MSTFEIHVGVTDEVREPTEDEAEAIQEHLNDYPRCRGKKIRDDRSHTIPGGRPRLRCTDCGVWMAVPTRLL